ncbi:MAG: HlyC/CorC family transporter [Roseburia sp.]|nr:HlyC/CorC family transporter [Roseburia sp.]
MDDGGSPGTGKVSLKRMVSRPVSKLFGVQIFKDLEDVTEEEIISMVNEGHEQGVLLASEAEMIQNIFEFGDKEAKDIMTHRKNVIAIDGNSTFLEVLEFVTNNNYSRYPVYEDDLDNIIGILHIKEMLKLCRKESIYEMPVKDIKDLIRSAKFIPETRNINTLFANMQSEKNHLMIVIDEYGQTAGIVAMEDIVEEIVGNIEDEHDEEEQMIEHFVDGSFLMDGMTPLEDALEVLEITFPKQDDFETLNGLLISLIHRIPNEDEHIITEAFGYAFEVLEVENKRIKKVKVTKVQEKDRNNEEDSCKSDEIIV